MASQDLENVPYPKQYIVGMQSVLGYSIEGLVLLRETASFTKAEFNAISVIIDRLKSKQVVL